ncbi:MAG: hypothetical protein ACK5JT_01335, partial [Hyphomicrobiaceae bacterium]
TFFRNCLMEALDRKECDPDLDPKATARTLLGVLIGVRVLSRTPVPNDQFDDMIRPALAMLHAVRRPVEA